MRFVASSNYILLMAMCGAVGVGHRSRGGWSRGVASVRGGNFIGDFRDVGRGRGMVSRYVTAFYRGGSA